MDADKIIARSPGAGSGDVSSRLATDIVLDERTKDMTVAEWWENYLLRLDAQAASMVDDAVDVLTVSHKNQREDIKNRQHERLVAKEIKGSGKGAGATSVASTAHAYDVQLKVMQGPAGVELPQHEAELILGRTFTLCPRLAGGPGGMCRIGRSNADDFQHPFGASLSFDPSVSHWHGKFTSFYGRVYFTDLGSSNGSCLNGASLERDVPYIVNTGDQLQLGGSMELAITLVPIGSSSSAGNSSDATTSQSGI